MYEWSFANGSMSSLKVFLRQTDRTLWLLSVFSRILSWVFVASEDLNQTWFQPVDYLPCRYVRKKSLGAFRIIIKLFMENQVDVKLHLIVITNSLCIKGNKHFCRFTLCQCKRNASCNLHISVSLWISQKMETSSNAQSMLDLPEAFEPYNTPNL